MESKGLSDRIKQIPESLLARLWRERAARAGALKAGDGRRVRIIYPGRIGTTAGPDFREAVFEEDGARMVRGDVEIHVNQSDWDSHGHGTDPRYNGVVLHVVGGMDAPSTTLHSGVRVPVLSLDSLLQGPEDPEEEPYGRESAPGHGAWALLRPHGYEPPDSSAALGALLDEAGDARFLRRSGTFRVLLQEEDPDQLIYAALMESLGYSQNRQPFLELAHRVSYETLVKATLRCAAGSRVEAIRETLLAEAGLGETPSSHETDSPAADPPRKRARPGAMTREQWHLFRVRPRNHPRRRIAGFAQALSLCLPPANEASPPWANIGLVDGLTKLMEGTGEPDPIPHRWLLLERALMGAQGSADDGGLGADHAGIGQGRARDMVANCVLPFLHALALARGDGSLAVGCIQGYHDLPRLQENEVTREMKKLLMWGLPQESGSPDERSVAFNARRQQGNVHLHRLMASPRAGAKGLQTT